MKHAAIALLAALAAVSLHAQEDPRVEKKRLIAELMEVIDVKRLTQASFEVMLGNMQRMAMQGVENDEEAKAAMKAEQARMDAFRDRLYTRLDYAKLTDDVYAPMFDKQFTNDELRQLIEFFKTKTGQKMAAMLSEFGIGALMHGNAIIQEAAQSTAAEMQKEENAKHPWRGTMADMRMLATALEARATDENEYPTVSLEELEPLLSPVYIRTMPKTDAWGTPFLYIGTGERYRIVSAGADKRFEWNARQMETVEQPRVMDNLDADIIFSDGQFIQLPKQAQGQM